MIIENGIGITSLLNGETIKKTLDPANETVNKGIYEATTLSAVDADLAVGNIKSGITLFGFAGDADVQDISDATAIEAEVIAGETFYAVSGGIRTGTMPIQSLSPVDDVVAAGYYGATNLSTIDVDLASANILSGVTIFGFAGAATVQDIADADAVLADVMNGKTFYSVTGGRKTGNLATVALSSAANSYPAGYHVGAASLTAVDADLVTGSIKSGITIFGVAGAATVQDIGDANAVLSDVKSGRTFYSVTGARKTGTLATVALSAAANSYPAGYHVGAASLTAVDADLVAANIADGITIFGVLGTLAGGALAEDILGYTDPGSTFTSGGGGYWQSAAVAPGADLTIASKTQAYDADSFAVATCFCGVKGIGTNEKIRLYMDGVQEAESPILTLYQVVILMASRAMSGSAECKMTQHNYDGGSAYAGRYWGAETGVDDVCMGIAIGSIKK